jgi:hypothetical protein
MSRDECLLVENDRGGEGGGREKRDEDEGKDGDAVVVMGGLHNAHLHRCGNRHRRRNRISQYGEYDDDDDTSSSRRIVSRGGIVVARMAPADADGMDDDGACPHRDYDEYRRRGWRGRRLLPHYWRRRDRAGLMRDRERRFRTRLGLDRTWILGADGEPAGERDRLPGQRRPRR